MKRKKTCPCCGKENPTGMMALHFIEVFTAAFAVEAKARAHTDYEGTKTWLLQKAAQMARENRHEAARELLRKADNMRKVFNYEDEFHALVKAVKPFRK